MYVFVELCSSLPKGEGHIFWDISQWRLHQCQRKTACPLYDLNTLWNILMTLSRNVEQDETTYPVQE